MPLRQSDPRNGRKNVQKHLELKDTNRRGPLGSRCHQLSQITEAARYIAPMNAVAVLSYRVAIALYCLIFSKRFSIRWRALYKAVS